MEETMEEHEVEFEAEEGTEKDVFLEYVEPEGEGEELDDLDMSDSITGMSAADKKKHQIEYLQLLKEIEAQNKLVDQLKDQLTKMCETSCLTKCELREVKKIRSCMETENIKLQCMLQKAIRMQNDLPSHCWNEIPIVTTIEEDIFPTIGNYGIMASLCITPREKEANERKGICSCSKKVKKSHPTCPETDDALNYETCKLFEQLSTKDKLINCLKAKVNQLEEEICLHRQARQNKIPSNCFEKNLNDSVADMQCTVDSLQKELYALLDKKAAQKGGPGRKKRKELQKLKEDYAQLLVSCSKKDSQLKEMESRIRGHCGGANNTSTYNQNDNVDLAELKVLREKVNDLRDEQEEYTCIIKEQAEQVEAYRKKYINAQQTVEEQKCMLEKIEANNKRIETQVEAEIKGIKAKFKEQLSEFAQYPSLLENEQIKLASACKEKDELEEKLRLVCRELKTARSQISPKENNKSDCSQKLAKCENELILQQSKLEEMQKEKELVCEELLKTKLELDTMRTESAKIITNTKERYESTKNSLSARIDILEKELAQCRATACLSITDREAVIKEMQTQLSTLSYSFDSAQKQIKTLKNHISFLSNDQCIPIKC